MTSPDGKTPSGALTGTGGIHAYATTTQEEWQAQITGGTSGHFTQAEDGFTQLIKGLERIPLIGSIIEVITGIEDGDLTDLGTWVNHLLYMLGMPHGLLGGWNPILALSNFINLLFGHGVITTQNQVPAANYAALAENSDINRLRDKGFQLGPYAVDGQSEWMWDNPVSPNHRHSVRTVRNGLITVYYVGGTYTGILGNEGTTVLQDWIWPTLSNEQLNPLFPKDIQLDMSKFEFISVPYPGSNFPRQLSVQNAVEYMVQLIQRIPGPFILTGISQGATVCSYIYDELRTGRLQDRFPDFLCGLMWGNPRRQQGMTFFDEKYGWWPDPRPSYGGPELPRLKDCDPNIWYEYFHGGDVVTAVELDPKGVHYARDQYIIRENSIINGNWMGLIQIIFEGPQSWVLAIQALVEIYFDIFSVIDLEGEISPHHQFWWSGFAPFGDNLDLDEGSGATHQGDTRCAAQLWIDKINSYGDMVTAPVSGERHQLEGELFAVTDYEVVSAGCKVFWVNVDVPQDYDAIILGVNAYDSDGNLIGMVTSTEAIIQGPPSFQQEPVSLEASFVMPQGARMACMVFDVEPLAMTTGIVWFMDPVFQTTNIIDSKLLTNIKNIPKLDATSIDGPLGEADMLTAFQNLIDGQASALKQAGLTAAQLSDLFTAQGQKAIDTSKALELAVEHQQILTTTTTQPVYSGLQPTGEVTFPLASFPQGTTLPYSTIAAGTAMAGVVTCQQAAEKGVIEFLANGPSGGTGSGVYINIYNLDPDTGWWTRLWTSSDIRSQIPDSTWGYVSTTIPVGHRINSTVGQRFFMEIACTGVDIKVASITMPQPNNPNTIPPNFGAYRVLAPTGGTSPSTIPQSLPTFSGEVPWVCLSQKNVAPTYQPPDHIAFTTAGIHSYVLPAWMRSGDLVDVVALGAGGSGGGTLATPGGFFGLGVVYQYGQGGTGGSWETGTVAYGSDIPDGTTNLWAIVGGGASPIFSGGGGDTVVGYGDLQTIAFDAAGGGANVSGQSMSWYHNATAGSYVLVFLHCADVISAYKIGTFDVRYNGVPMTCLGMEQIGAAASTLQVFGLPNAPGGSKLVEVENTSSTIMAGNSVSYTGVATTGDVVTAPNNSSGTALTQAVTLSDHQMAVQAFGTRNYSMTASNGGTQRGYNYYGTTSPNYQCGVNITDSAVSTTFSSTASQADSWGSIAVILYAKPATELYRADGGLAGGVGGSQNLNPFNTNNTSNGIGVANITYQGKTYFGGSNVALGANGSPPGGGSGGCSASNAELLGGVGSTYFVARQK